MRIASIAAIAAVTLAAVSVTSCVTTEKVNQVNGKIQAGLADLCPKVETAHIGFAFLKAIFKIPKVAIEAEDQAYEAAQEFCEDPSSVTLQSAPQKVLDALNKINAARAKASGSN